MIELSLVGIGSGNPEHLTLQAVRALNEADLILIPEKGAAKDELAQIRREICRNVLTDDTPIVGFTLPVRDEKITDYDARVNDWHDRIAVVWKQAIETHLPESGTVAFLVWGDPSLYDSTLRIAGRVKSKMSLDIKVIPGITSIQTLTAAHAMPVNTINGPFTVTTGRRLRDEGMPAGMDKVVVMLDGECSFTKLNPEGLYIHWTAYAGMQGEISLSGPLSQMTDVIIETRKAARKERGWIMDIYMLSTGDHLLA